MALVKYGSIASQLSGKVGGVVFAQGHGGPYVRTWRKTVQSLTQWNTISRDHLQSASTLYDTLNAEQMIAWREWASQNPVTNRLGDRHLLNANAAFVQLNARLLWAGKSTILQPPIDTAPQPISGLTPTSVSGVSATIDYTQDTLPSATGLMIHAAPVPKAGRQYYMNKLRMIKFVDTPATSPVDIFTDLSAHFGYLAVGTKLVVRVQTIGTATGLVSPFATGAVVTTAPTP
jgi:hypothetical protein